MSSGRKHRRWQVLRHRDRSGPPRVGGEGRKVKYESRGRTAHGGSWGAVTTVSDVKFAREVDREVDCDYRPDAS
jgi:hypothetical protein